MMQPEPWWEHFCFRGFLNYLSTLSVVYQRVLVWVIALMCLPLPERC
jgi:hypothetical protein